MQKSRKRQTVAPHAGRVSETWATIKRIQGAVDRKPMDNMELILKMNRPLHSKRTRLVGDAFEIQTQTEFFDFSCLRRIIWKINSIVRSNYNMHKKTLFIRFGSTKVIDRLTWVLLECICYAALTNYNLTVFIEGKIINDRVFYKMKNSTIYFLNNGLYDDFKHYFLFNIKSDYYRNIMPRQSIETADFSIKYADINSFFLNNGLPDEFSANLTETIFELVGNQCEHGFSDCLYDINVCKNTKKDGTPFTIVSVALVGFSEISFGNALKDKILLLKNEQDLRYNTVKEAYNYHKQHFTRSYTEADFFCTAAFQDRISSRLQRCESGGTGLTKLILSLEEYSDQYQCYMVCGNRFMLFDAKYLDSNSEGWIGFNDMKNFVSSIPDESVFTESPIYMPGVAYNLVFVVK